MLNTINLPAIIMANIMGFMLCMMMLVGKSWQRIGTGSEKSAIRIMLISTMISCIVDPIVFWADGKPGPGAFLIVYIGNAWLFLCNIIVGPSWYQLVTSHVRGGVSIMHKRISRTVLAVGALILLLNPFVHLVFRVDANNVYSRGPFFWVYIVADALFVIEGTVSYLLAKKRGGVLQFFPVWQFLLPVIVGVVIQASFYGLSTIWPCLVISINGMLFCLQSESIYRDELTGLYNRNYLETLKKSLAKHPHVMAAMMIDLNDFKSINDRFGHLVGDQALIECGRILRETVGARGNVIRYAGDEFIVLLNTQDIGEVSSMAKTINEHLEQFNKTAVVDYRLSASIGYSLFDFATQTPDQLMNIIDSKMYYDKAAYYQLHPELNRRY